VIGFIGVTSLEQWKKYIEAFLQGLTDTGYTEGSNVAIAEVQAAADHMKQPLIVAKASADADIDAAFATFAERKVDTLLVNPDPFLLGRRERIAALALRHGIATIFHIHEPVVAGGLISSGASFADSHR
jgi:putative ABC transport system substrate-binding protein